MPTYINLINWTENGVAGFRNTVDRAESAQQLAGKFGGKLEVYWTAGPYDIVAISEFPDGESATAFALTLGSQGNIRTTTLRGFNAEEMRRIISKTD